MKFIDQTFVSRRERLSARGLFQLLDWNMLKELLKQVTKVVGWIELRKSIFDLSFVTMVQKRVKSPIVPSEHYAHAAFIFYRKPRFELL